MPTKITSKKIIKLIKKNSQTMEDLLKENEEYNKRLEDLHKENQKFVDLMNEEYGWGNWQNVDVKELTFTPKEEFVKSYYIIKNPAVQERVEVDDIQTIESQAESVI